MPNRLRRALAVACAALIFCAVLSGAAAPDGNLHVIDDLGDADGAQVADVDRDGRVDVVAASSRHRGRSSKIYWYRQGKSPRHWTRHPIYTGDRLKKVEGIDVHDYDGDGTPEVFALDQAGGVLAVFSAETEKPAGSWRMCLADRNCYGAQDSMIADIAGDGAPELVYTWEGGDADSGGVKCLRYTGGPVGEADSWTVSTLVDHPGAWWLCSSGMLDLDGDGSRDDIVFGARRNRNSSPRPGVFWLEGPEDEGGEWSEHVIDDSPEAVLQLDAGDFDGDGVARDLVACAGPFQHAYLYTYPDWERRKIELPADRGVWNARRTPYRAGGRHGIVLTLANDHTYVLHWTGQSWTQRRLFSNTYGHPLDDRIIYTDLDGDGAAEAVIPDSGGNRLFWVSFAHVRPTR